MKNPAPLSAMTFNPAARPGDADWRGCTWARRRWLGRVTTSHPIEPATTGHRCGQESSGSSRTCKDQRPGSVLSENGRYRIPADNPFLATVGARREIWAYGFRNPHRLTWMTPARKGAPLLVANSIGLHTWETVNIVHRGANYGYSAREGNQSLGIDNQTAPLPAQDLIPVRPLRRGNFRHDGADLPGCASAQARRGRLNRQRVCISRNAGSRAARGKYVFTDITTGHIWYADVREMIAADDGDPTTLAKIWRSMCDGLTHQRLRRSCIRPC